MDGRIASTLGFALGIADQVSSALWRDHVGTALTQPQFLALSELCHTPGIGHFELAERIGVDKVTIGPIIKKLADQGAMERGVDRNDARRSVLKITLAGMGLLRDHMAAAERMTEALMRPLSLTEQAVVVQAWATMARLSQRHPGTSRILPGAAIPPPGHYPWYFLRITRRSYRRIWRELAGDEISPSQFAIMDAIQRVQPLDIRTAAALSKVEETTAIRIVMRSVRTRLIRDRRDPDDARRSLLSLTDQGQAQHVRITSLLPDIQAELCEGLPDRVFPEVDRLTRIIARWP